MVAALVILHDPNPELEQLAEPVLALAKVSTVSHWSLYPVMSLLGSFVGGLKVILKQFPLVTARPVLVGASGMVLGMALTADP
jgi:glutaredoxin-related protein